VQEKEDDKMIRFLWEWITEESGWIMIIAWFLQGAGIALIALGLKHL
jgi:hypothetical protein